MADPDLQFCGAEAYEMSALIQPQDGFVYSSVLSVSEQPYSCGIGWCVSQVGISELSATTKNCRHVPPCVEFESRRRGDDAGCGLRARRGGVEPGRLAQRYRFKGHVDDHYLSGSYLVLAMMMRGLRGVLSPSVDAGKALLMDSAHSDLLVVDGYAVELAYSGDDFTKNLITALGEIRVIPVFRTVGSARLITPKA